MNSLKGASFPQIAISVCKLCRVAVGSGRKSSELKLQNSWKILEVQHDLKCVDSVVRSALLLRQRGKPHVSFPFTFAGLYLRSSHCGNCPKGYFHSVANSKTFMFISITHAHFEELKRYFTTFLYLFIIIISNRRVFII